MRRTWGAGKFLSLDPGVGCKDVLSLRSSANYLLVTFPFLFEHFNKHFCPSTKLSFPLHIYTPATSRIDMTCVLTGDAV